MRPARRRHRADGGLLLAAHAAGLGLLPAAVPAAAAFQRRLSAAYGVVRERVGDMLGAVSESVVGAATVRAYASRSAPAAPIDAASTGTAAAATRAQGLVAADLLHRRAGRRARQRRRGRRRRRCSASPASITPGELVAFLFLVTLFVGPGADRHRGAQRGAERRSPAGAACSACSTRRPTSPTPGRAGVTLPRGPDRRPLRGRRLRLPRRAAPCCTTSTWRSRRAVAGRDRRGDRVGQDHVRQAADPADGPGPRPGAASTAWTCGRSRFASLRDGS